MSEVRYDVAELAPWCSLSVVTENVSAAEATRLVEERGGAARVRFAGDEGQREPVPWPLISER